MWANNPGFRTSQSGEEDNQCLDLYHIYRENILFGRTEDNKMYNQVRKKVFTFTRLKSRFWSVLPLLLISPFFRQETGLRLENRGWVFANIFLSSFTFLIYLRIFVNIFEYYFTKVNLSGGQKQRVALARAAYSQPEVFPLWQCKQARKPRSYANSKLWPTDRV